MSITGNWTFASRSPMGNDDGTLNLVADGQLLTGTITGKDGETEILDGKADGNTASWKVQISKPMPIMLEFTVEVADNTFSGKIKLGAFGESTITGTRL